MAVLVQKGFPTDVQQIISDVNEYYLILCVKITGIVIAMVNADGPNLDSPIMFYYCFQHLNGCYDKLEIEGDFNKILDPDLDRNTLVWKKKSLVKKTIKRYMEELNLIDPWHLMFPAKIKY